MSLKTDAKLILYPSGYGDGKWYSFKGSDFDVVRNTSATRYNKTGVLETVLPNYPRLDYLNGTPDILIEPEKENELIKSEEFDDAAWFYFRASNSPDQIEAPDKNTTADKILADTDNDSHGIFQSPPDIINGQNYTFSCFCKKSELNNVILGAASAFDVSTPTIVANFDLNNGVITDLETGGTGGTAWIEDYNNGWYRCSILMTADGTTMRPTVYLANGNTLASRIFIGNNIDGIYIWGAQLEKGEYPTSYTHTLGSTVTREADVHTVTVPAGTTEIREYLPNGTYNSITTIPATYQIPNGRWQKIIMI